MIVDLFYADFYFVFLVAINVIEKKGGTSCTQEELRFPKEFFVIFFILNERLSI